jgi:hypothetical protein
VNDISHLDRVEAGYEVQTTTRSPAARTRSRTDVANPPRRLLAIAAAPDGARFNEGRSHQYSRLVCRLSEILSQIHRRYTFGRDGDLRAQQHGSTSRSQILSAGELEAYAYSETQRHRRPTNEHNQQKIILVSNGMKGWGRKNWKQ